MKVFSTLIASSSIAAAFSIPTFRDFVDAVEGQSPFASAEKYLVRLSPEETRWVTEDEKWALRREGLRFFDITDDAAETELRVLETTRATKKVSYPKKPTQNETLSELLKQLDKKNMRKHLETFTGFHTRYYKSDYGRQSSDWLFDQVNETLAAGGAGVVQKFEHPWGKSRCRHVVLCYEAGRV